MVDNIDADNGRAREPGDGVLPGTGLGEEAHGQAHSQAHPIGSPQNEPPEGVGEPEPTIEEQRLAHLFSKWRGRFSDVPDSRFDQVVQDLRVPLSIKSIARGLVEAGYCAHLSPDTVRMNLQKFRDAMGWPRYMDQFAEPAQEKEDEADKLIEEQPAIRQLHWLVRVQHARVRKALKTEAMMGGLTLAQTADEIKLMNALLDKELEIQLKTGEMKPAPQQPMKLEIEGIPIHEPAEAMRVVCAYRRIKALLAARTAEPRGPTGEEAPPGAESGPMGPGPGADGEHGRT